MRYRRLGYRYTMMITTQSGPWGDPWQVRTGSVVLAQPRWRPEYDVIESARSVLVTVEIAGVSDEDLEVLLFEDALVVEGRRSLPPCEEDCVYHAVGIRQGPFRVEVPLPGRIDPDTVKVSYERGLLEIRMPKVGEGGSHDF